MAPKGKAKAKAAAAKAKAKAAAKAAAAAVSPTSSLLEAADAQQRRATNRVLRDRSTDEMTSSTIRDTFSSLSPYEIDHVNFSMLISAGVEVLCVFGLVCFRPTTY